MKGYEFCTAGNMLFHVLESLSPPPTPGMLMSDSTMNVLPVDRLMGEPAVMQLRHMSPGLAGEPQLGPRDTPAELKGVPGLQTIVPAGAACTNNASQPHSKRHAGSVFLMICV